jgi:outer membrane protein OmpA-like peptidoglycan-associated protein
MVRWRLAAVFLCSAAIAPWLGVASSANAEDVSVNMDALGPTPAPKPVPPAKIVTPPVSPNAVRSEIVPDDPAPAPKPVQPKPQPKPALKPVADTTPVPASAPASATNEIDFIGRTKQTSTPPSASQEPQAPKPVMALPTPPAEPAPPAAPKPAPVVTAVPAQPPKPAAPKKPAGPSPVQVNASGLEGEQDPNAKPKGTPLTAVAPDGILYVPKNTQSLPQPVSVPTTAPGEYEAGANPLTLPPALPEAPPLPVPEPSAALPALIAAPVANAPAPVKPAKMALKPAATATPTAAAPTTAPAATAPVAPPTTQAIAAVAPSAPAAPARKQERASALSGQATAMQIKFEPGQVALSAETQGLLDQIADPLKATGMRLQLAAYSGPPGDNSSDARRLSLKRALAVRNYLGTRGVPKITVNIASFGGAVEGDTDRVDLMVPVSQVTKLNATP